MKTCFGADNVNNDNDASFKSCSASPKFGGDDGTVLQKLPGCNPIQSGPAEATLATGTDCKNVASTTSELSSIIRSSLPALSVKLGQKQVGHSRSGFGSAKEPITAATQLALTNDSSLPLTSTRDCKEPVYITVTPTVTVTVEGPANSTTRDPTSVVAQHTPALVSAGGNMHKRHGNLHHKN